MNASHEHRRRIVAMIQDDGDTWDLSDRDQAALRHMLGLVNALAEGLAQQFGKTIEEVLGVYGTIVEKEQEPME